MYMYVHSVNMVFVMVTSCLCEKHIELLCCNQCMNVCLHRSIPACVGQPQGRAADTDSPRPATLLQALTIHSEVSVALYWPFTIYPCCVFFSIWALSSHRSCADMHCMCSQLLQRLKFALWWPFTMHLLDVVTPYHTFKAALTCTHAHAHTLTRITVLLN